MVVRMTESTSNKRSSSTNCNFDGVNALCVSEALHQTAIVTGRNPLDIHMPMKSRMTALPSDVPVIVCAQRLPKLNKNMRKYQNRRVRPGSISRGFDSWNWAAVRVTSARIDGDMRKDRTASW